MSKFLLILFSLTLAQFSNAGWVKPNNPEAVKKAVLESYRKYQWSCPFKVTDLQSGTVKDENATNMGDLLDYSTEVLVSDNKSQPLIQLGFTHQEDDWFSKSNFDIHTDASFKEILKINFAQYVYQTILVNVGTMDNPKYEKQTVLRRTRIGQCARK